jgi:hypothetical protein
LGLNGYFEVDLEMLPGGVGMIAYNNKALEAKVHVESLWELREVLKVTGGLNV